MASWLERELIVADKYVEVTTRSWLSRLMNSVVGVLIGLLLVVIAIWLLWMNEGRTDLSKVAERSVPISAETVDPAANGKFVAATGKLTSSELLGDPGYLKPGNYIRLVRRVEMYAWEEDTRSETKTNVGGSETTTTEYTYEKRWTSSPDDSSRFKVPEGHQNPEMALKGTSFRVRSAQVGAYEIDPSTITLPGTEDLPLSEANIEAGQGRLEGEYLYIGRGSLQSPQVGDLRVRYEIVPAGINVTVLGQVDGNRLVSYTSREGETLYRAFQGDRAAAIEALATEHVMMSWLLRFLGFIMMWIGFMLVAEPLSVFLDFLPILGRMSRMATSIATFGLALGLSLLIIILSIIFHNILILLFILGVIAVIGFLLYRRGQAQKAPGKASPA
jgi:hypothetical protein